VFAWQAEGASDVGGREGVGGPGQLEVDGVARVVAKDLEHLKAVERILGVGHTPSLHGPGR
jgi:hypothetical protein